MKRTNTRNIYVPQLLTDGTDAAEEHNARVYNWVKRTALPTLDEYVISPFETVMKEEVMTAAIEAEELGEGAWLRGRHTKRWDLGGVSFQAAAYRHSSIAHEVVLGQTQNFLEDCIADNAVSVHREFVRRTDNGTHVSTDYVLGEIDRWRNVHTKFYNKQEVQIFEPGTEKTYVPRLEEAVVHVALDTKRFGVVNEANARVYLQAKALDKELGGFVRDFTERIRDRHGVDVVEGNLEADYEMTDGASVRYLFFPKETSVQYGKMIDALSARGDTLVASSGDLVLLSDLGFKEAYSIGGRGKLSVRTVRGEDNLGVCTIDRVEKGQVAYSVLDNADKGVYVSARNVLDRIAGLRSNFSNGATQLKVDFFPGAPQGF